MTTREMTPDQTFLNYYQKFREELNIAFTHYEIAKYLNECKSKRKQEFSEAITFFSLTTNAHLFMTVMSLCRFIDKDKYTLNLDIFLNFVEKNLELFSTKAYKAHLLAEGREGDDFQHWVRLHKEISIETVNSDREKVKALRIHNIKTWRDKKLAHIQRSFVNNNIDVVKEFSITVKEIDNIIRDLDEILDRYLLAYDGSSWSLGLPPTIPQMEHIMDAIKFSRETKRK